MQEAEHPAATVQAQISENGNIHDFTSVTKV